METVTPLYPKTEGVLYSIVGMVCQSCINNLALFTQFKGKYNIDFINSILKASNEAQLMPNNKSRQAIKKNKRTDLVALNMGLCGNMLTLLKYIDESFDAGVADNMKQLAGASYYLKATRLNWEASTTMFGMAENFMNTYAKELAAGGLPDGFADDFATNADQFADALKGFLTYKNTAEEGTVAKVTANNALYTRLQAVMEDGKYIFRNDAALQKQFSYNALMKKAAGPGKTGCRIVLQATQSLLPITTATIYLQPGNHKLISENKGIYKSELPAGIYSFVITDPQFAGKSGNFTITPGAMRHIKFVLSPAVTETLSAQERVG